MKTDSGIEIAHLPDLDIETKEPKVLQMEREIYKTKTTGEEMIPFSCLEWIENVRSEGQMAATRDVLIHSLKTSGYMNKYPIVVHKISAKKYRVLCGNRRTLALMEIKEKDPNLFKNVLPGGKIPAVILENLTEDEEGILLVDHSSIEDRVGLDDEGYFHAIVRLMRSGVNTQADIAAKLNLFKHKDGEMVPNRSFIQPRVNLARLPEEVQEQYLKLMRGDKTVKCRWGDIATLFKLWNEGRDGGHHDGGDKFKEFWAKVSDPNRGSDKASGPKMLSKTELEEATQHFNSRNALRLSNLVQGKDQVDDNGNPIDLQIIDREITNLELAAELLEDIKQHMGATKFKKMVDAIQKEKIEAARKAQEAEAAAEEE